MGKKLKVILAAGGTGGHIFPAEALAEELTKRGHTAILVTDKRREQYTFTAKNNIDVHVVSSAGSGGGVKSAIKSVFSIMVGIFQANSLIKKLQPDAIVGFGGYPSFPTMIAAYYQKIPSVIHEQNSVLGRVNRVLASVADKIALSFEGTQRISAKDEAKTILTGNPVRPEIKAIREVSYPELKNGEHLHLLVTGGSQGAAVFSDIVPAALVSLPPELRKRIRIDQQCRKEDIERVRKIYDDAGINADLATFFTDVSSRLAAAHLLICRAGASTIAEITVSGRPAILVPYMHAMDDHQTTNAGAIADKGAAFVVSQKIVNAEILAGYIKDFLNHPEKLQNTAINAFETGIVDADKRLADVVESVI